MPRQFFSAARGLPGAEPAQTRKKRLCDAKYIPFPHRSARRAPNFFAPKRRMCFEKADFLRSVERQTRQNALRCGNPRRALMAHRGFFISGAKGRAFCCQRGKHRAAAHSLPKGSSHVCAARSVFSAVHAAGENESNFLRVCGRELCEARHGKNLLPVLPM